MRALWLLVPLLLAAGQPKDAPGAMDFTVTIDGVTVGGIQSLSFSAGGKKKPRVHLVYDSDVAKDLHAWASQGAKGKKRTVKVQSKEPISGAIDRNDVYSGCVPALLTASGKPGKAGKGIQAVDLDCDKVESPPAKLPK